MKFTQRSFFYRSLLVVGRILAELSLRETDSLEKELVEVLSKKQKYLKTAA